jgi:hypothetical protein
MTKLYTFDRDGDKIKCQCGKPIGIDKGNHINMIANSFIYTGTKRNG